MQDWDGLRTAFEVVRHGTVSGAAQALGVHHATVIRHVDALEGRLGVKLFQRHARGYTPTEAGEDLARVAQATDDQFAQLASRLSGQGSAVQGELVVTTLASFTRRLMPALADFQSSYPDLRLVYRTGRRIFRLEYGEAHVAIRAGNPPKELDNVVQELATLQTALYAAPEYIERRGMPTEANVLEHDFIGPDDEQSGGPAMRWVAANVPRDRVVFRADEDLSHFAALRAGIGLGFSPVGEAGEGLVEVLPSREEWASRLWLVTHVDLHRTAKVQALTKHLKASLKDCA
ncbi:LysR family transcriptional regulator [Maritimibacter sp. UBA3975]|uniref:LysR family transcriptional regulator n=1 Tax=Maritimibacter sp. UBA3975 TaxID=1946833 RepID=UPI000C091528|nr:LysR family transcriptional regulator [Maritimibacter sp. UBA3975]MAM62761.1 LysR family transcriptional regulator [Maritimibacter sp.]|tara:strand:+ start:8857 stop:9723 length:867 start_codon:yes stop_codon:yes gene_type:complete